MRIIIGAPGNGAVLKEALKEKLAGDERVSALVDIWVDLRLDPASSYGPKVGEVSAYETRC